MNPISDMTKTNILRAVLFVLILLGLAVAVAVADVLIEKIGWYLPRVEAIIFWGLTCGKVRDWLTSRVWIGTKSTMLP